MQRLDFRRDLLRFPYFAPGGGVEVTVNDIGWDQISTPAGTQVWAGVTYSVALDLFVAVAQSGGAANQRAMTSVDGSDGSWTLRTLSSAHAWRSVAYSPDLNLFAAVSNAPSAIYTSPDGITWTARTVPANNIAFTDIVWGAGVFVAVGNAVGSGSLGLKATTSTDGITWAGPFHTGSNRNWESIAFDPVSSTFVIVASNTGADQTSHSNDGQNWTNEPAASANTWKGVTWSPGVGRFVAVSEINNAVMYSDDLGVTWIAATGAGVNAWQAVAWSPDLERFVAVSSSGANPFSQSSLDGITWEFDSVPNTNARHDLVWGPEIGAFIAVGAVTADAAWRSCSHYTVS